VQVNQERALLAKCLNYYYEMVKKPGETRGYVEVVPLKISQGKKL
jgi:hypothetical protein